MSKFQLETSHYPMELILLLIDQIDTSNLRKQQLLHMEPTRLANNKSSRIKSSIKDLRVWWPIHVAAVFPNLWVQYVLVVEKVLLEVISMQIIAQWV